MAAEFGKFAGIGHHQHRPPSGEHHFLGPDARRRRVRAWLARASALAQGTVTEARPRPADPVLACQLADLAGDPGLVRLWCVGPPAVQLQVPVDQLPASGVSLSVRRYEPVGVVAAITPYNAAFMMAMQKIIPALLAGCTVILKASPEAPGEAYVIAEIAESRRWLQVACIVTTRERWEHPGST